MSVKTVVIWDEVGQSPIRYFTSDKDLTHLDRQYINTYTKDKKETRLLEELSQLMYDPNGNMLQVLSQDFPYEAVRDGARVIVCGFLP